MFMLVFAAVGVFGAGMLAIAAGIPIKDFGYGNTLILSGVMAWCTSAIMLSLWACFRDLKKGQQFQAAKPESDAAGADARPASPPAPTLPPGWPEAIPERAQPAPAAPPPAPAPPPPVAREPRRNLLFTSNRRAKDAGPRDITAPADAGAPPSATSSLAPNPAPEPRPSAPDDARALPRRSELPPRTLRPSATIAPREPAPPPAPPPPPPASEDAPREPAPLEISAAPPREPERSARSDSANVSVLKSGVVDGMAYWLYSDGSIEAQMPEGMMRFTSIDELRAHLDKRA